MTQRPVLHHKRNTEISMRIVDDTSFELHNLRRFLEDIRDWPDGAKVEVWKYSGPQEPAEAGIKVTREEEM